METGRGERRNPIVVRIKTIGVGRLEAGDGCARARGFDALLQPQRRQVARLVERLDRGALLLVGENLVDLGHAARSVGQRRNCLRTTYFESGVDPTHLRRHQHPT